MVSFEHARSATHTACRRFLNLRRCLQGQFHVSSALPVSYQIEEVVGLFDLGNEARPDASPLSCRQTLPALPCAGMLHGATVSCDLQTLLRGIITDSFPAQLAAKAEPGAKRRFIVIDEVVDQIYGAALRTVRSCVLNHLEWCFC